MTKFLIELEGGIEKYVAATESDAFQCAKYLLGKYKNVYPEKKVRLATIQDDAEVTWPREAPT